MREGTGERANRATNQPTKQPTKQTSSFCCIPELQSLPSPALDWSVGIFPRSTKLEKGLQSSGALCLPWPSSFYFCSSPTASSTCSPTSLAWGTSGSAIQAISINNNLAKKWRTDLTNRTSRSIAWASNNRIDQSMLNLPLQIVIIK